jgi:hypothetical protein
MRNESRFRTIERADPARYKHFLEESESAARRRYSVYQQLAGITVPMDAPPGDDGTAPVPAKEAK